MPATAADPLLALPLRIGLLTSSRFWRGSSSVFAVLARGLAERGHSTTALVAYQALEDGFRARGVAVRRLPVGHTTLVGALALRRALDVSDLATDLIVVDRARDIRLAAVAGLGRPLAVVYAISTPRPPRDLLTRLAFRRVGLTVFLSEELARRALAEASFLRRAPYCVIPNGVDCTRFRPDAEAAGAFRERHGLGEGAVLLGVGALEPEKRWDLLLEGLALLAASAPPLVLCGSGALERALRERAKQLRLDVRFLGEVKPAELIGAYNAATCVVHTRPDEVFALALIEALACGRPVLAADGGGTRELVGTAGVLAPPGDPRAFARELKGLLADPSRRAALGAAARRRAVEHFSVDRMVKDYAAALEGLAAASAGRSLRRAVSPSH